MKNILVEDVIVLVRIKVMKFLQKPHVQSCSFHRPTRQRFFSSSGYDNDPIGVKMMRVMRDTPERNRRCEHRVGGRGFDKHPA